MNSMRYKDALYETRRVADLRRLMNSAAELYGDSAAYLSRCAGGGFVPISYRQFRSDATALGTALLAAGHLGEGSGGDMPHTMRGGKVAIISENSYEYIVAYFAVVCGGGTAVPIDPRLPAAEVQGLLARTKASAVFHSKKYAGAVQAENETAATRICTSDIPQLIAEGERLIKGGDDRYFRTVIDPHQICSLLYTSGTTGAAKGVMLTHANLVSNVMGLSAFINASGMVTLSVLPMHHTLEFTCDILAAMYQGCTVAVCEGLRYIMRDLAESRANVIIGVPLVFEKMHRNIMKTAERAGRRDLLRGLINLAKLSEGRIPPKLMFRSVHKALGGHMKLFLVGGAPCDPRIISDFNAMGIRMIQGYGMTESAPIISVGKDRCSKDASVGLPLHGTFVQIDGADADGVGEIVVAGASVMPGYYEDEEATRAAMPGGRLRTGDLGRFDEDGFLYITGRKKNLIVLNSGKNVYPEEVEARLLRSPYIEETVVTGDSGERVAVCAEIFPDLAAIERDFGAACAKGDDLRKIIDREVDKANGSMPPHMSVRRFTLRQEPFEKTTTKKIRRG
ncbi:MAG: AMP-binding protein [Clostridiales Family XIII bacterium]|nr:AMP-binding protein [Clostridiales Family XIII bacterium]